LRPQKRTVATASFRPSFAWRGDRSRPRAAQPPQPQPWPQPPPPPPCPPHPAATLTRRDSVSLSKTWKVDKLTSAISSSPRKIRRALSCNAAFVGAVAEVPPVMARETPAAPNAKAVLLVFRFGFRSPSPFEVSESEHPVAPYKPVEAELGSNDAAMREPTDLSLNRYKEIEQEQIAR
jgi:hypothetical protein